MAQQWGAPRDQQQPKQGKRWGRKLVIGFFLFVAIVAVLESPLTRVRGVSVTGNTSIPASEILADSQIHTGMSIWQVNQASTERVLMNKYPLIASVTVKRDVWTGQVVLSIEEKHIVGILESSGKFYNLLDDGKVYGELPGKQGFIWPIVTLDAKVSSIQTGAVPDPTLSILCQQLSKLNPTATNQISEIHLDLYGTASIYLNNGFVAECKVNTFATTMTGIRESVQYFLDKGYSPGLIDMTGAPPYRYTPFPETKKEGSHP